MPESAKDHAPYRADQVGSLLRPPELKEARERRVRGEITAEALAAVEDRLIRDAVQKQEAAGLRAVTDGDFRRQSWSSDFLSAIGGVAQTSGPAGNAQQLAVPVGQIVRDWQPPTPRVETRLALPAGGIQVKSFTFLKGVTTRVPKVTMPSPSMLHFRGGRGGVDRAAYPDMDKFFADLAAVWANEIRALGEAGCRYVQLDDTNLAYLCDTRLRERVRGIGEDPAKLPSLYARLINDAIAGRPAGMRVAVHLCRGNSLSRGHAEGGYEPVAEAIFNETKVDGFFLEYDDPRSGDFAPLRFVPKGDLRIVLGVITSKFGHLEAKDAVKRRIEEAGKYMPLDQICLSPQCGFASHTGGNIITEDQQWAKLRHVVELAQEIWPGG
jgi:5-methyltetrahydropteroyltriglutamate--homocysteine methyltransferase